MRHIVRKVSKATCHSEASGLVSTIVTLWREMASTAAVSDSNDSLFWLVSGSSSGETARRKRSRAAPSTAGRMVSAAVGLLATDEPPKPETSGATLKTHPLGQASSARIAVPAWRADSSRQVPDLESAGR